MYCIVCCVSGSLLCLPVKPPAPSVLLENRFLEDEEREKLSVAFVVKRETFACVSSVLPPHLKDSSQFREC